MYSIMCLAGKEDMGVFSVKAGDRSVTIDDRGNWTFVFDGVKHSFSYLDIQFILFAMEQQKWRVGIEYAIDDHRDFIDFDKIDEDVFVDICMDEVKALWELSIDWAEPDYNEIVCDVAADHEVWRGDD